MDLSRHLAAHLVALRRAQGLTQAQLAARADVPRSTLAHLETGAGNPTLKVLTALADALRTPVGELLRPPHPAVRHFRAAELVEHARGGVRVRELLPDPIPGAAFERMALPTGTRMKGTPHRAGTREYLACEQGRVTLWCAGERFDLDAGDVLVFRGDQKHAYGNDGPDDAVAFSVVVWAPAG